MNVYLEVIVMKNSMITLCLCTLLGFINSITADTLVNERTSQDQKTPALAQLPNGNAIVVWNSYLHDGGSGAIVGRFLGTDGLPLGGEFQINFISEGNQTEPTVAVNPNGIILTAWRGPSENSDSENIIARLFDPNGLPLTNDILINEHTDDKQLVPHAYAMPDGTFATVWESLGIPSRNKKVISLRLINAEGQFITPEVSASDTPSYTCRYADIAGNSQGGLTVAWLEDRTSNNIRIRHFDPNGTAIAPSAQVNTERFKSLTRPSIAISAQDALAVTWDGDPNHYTGDDIHIRLYDPNHTPLGDQFIASQHTLGAQWNPSVSFCEPNGLIITWETTSSIPENEIDIAVRGFSFNGQPRTDEFILNQHQESDQANPVLSLTTTHHYYAWQSKDQDGSDWDIYSQTGPKILSIDLNEDGIVNSEDYQRLFELNPNLMEDHQYDHLDLWTFYTQWLTTP
jgi:large repetitive protein